MTILKYGHITPKELKCRGCGAELSYTPSDVKYHTNRFHEYYYVVCPVCGKFCFVNNEGDVKK